MGLYPAAGGATPAIKTSPVFTGAGAPAALTTGTDTTPTAGSVYFGALFLPYRAEFTGIGYLIGSVGGTDKAVLTLYDTSGIPLAWSALAGTTVGTAATVQEIAFTAPVVLDAPGIYYISVSMDGTTARLRLGVACGTRGGSQAGVFGTLDAITTLPVTSGAGPIAYLY